MTDAALIHYGVKGMKWGVRRYQPYPRGRRPKAKGGKPGKEIGKARDNNSVKNRKETQERRRKRAMKLVGVAAGVTIASAVAYSATKRMSMNNIRNYMSTTSGGLDSIYNKTLDQLDNRDVFVPKGTTFSRMTTNPKKTSNMSYMSFDKSDIDRYRSIYDKTINSKAGSSGFYEVKMKNTKPIKAASQRAQVETFSKLMDDETFKQGVKKLKFHNPMATQEVSKILDTGGPLGEETKKGMFNLFVGAFGEGESNKAVKMFNEQMRKEGYNSLVDLHDKGLKIAKNPIINIAPDNTLATESVKKVNKLMKIASGIRLEKV